MSTLSINTIARHLYILNKIAKAYGNRSTNNYRLKDTEKQKLYYSIKEKIIKKYGTYIETHRVFGGISNLYQIGEHTFHDFTTIHSLVANKVDRYFSRFYFFGEDEFGYYMQDDSNRYKYRFPLTTKGTEYTQSEIDPINKEIEKLKNLKFIKPPKDSEEIISIEEEDLAFNFLISII